MFSRVSKEQIVFIKIFLSYVIKRILAQCRNCFNYLQQMIQVQKKGGSKLEIADHNKPVAENIMRIIREKGLKQTFVAKNAGYTPQMLNDMLAGRKIIKISDVIRICPILGVDANYLFEIEKEGKQ